MYGCETWSTTNGDEEKWLVLKEKFLEEYMDLFQRMKCTEEELME